MITEDLPSGLIIVRDKPEPPPPKPNNEPTDASQPLESSWRWFEGLSESERDELLGFLPSLFLRVDYGFSLKEAVYQLMRRAGHLSGKEFEIWT